MNHPEFNIEGTMTGRFSARRDEKTLAYAALYGGKSPEMREALAERLARLVKEDES